MGVCGCLCLSKLNISLRTLRLGLTAVALLLLRTLAWTGTLAFLCLQLGGSRSWDFSASVIAWANSYNKSPPLSLSPSIYMVHFSRKPWLIQNPDWCSPNQRFSVLKPKLRVGQETVSEGRTDFSPWPRVFWGVVSLKGKIHKEVAWAGDSPALENGYYSACNIGFS